MSNCCIHGSTNTICPIFIRVFKDGDSYFWIDIAQSTDATTTTTTTTTTIIRKVMSMFIMGPTITVSFPRHEQISCVVYYPQKYDHHNLSSLGGGGGGGGGRKKGHEGEKVFMESTCKGTLATFIGICILCLLQK